MANHDVIALHSDTEEEQTEGVFGVEASLLPETRRLAPRFKIAEWNDAYLRYMQRRLRRNPRDLKSHVRRILMLHDQGRNEACFGALVDLFLVLGSGGRALRNKLLAQLQEDLSSAQRVFLQEHLEGGLTSLDPLPEETVASLTGGLSGTTDIVVGETSVGNDPLETAREYMNRQPPDDEAAQAILEGVLKQDPGREDACRELLALYRRNRLAAPFRRTYAALMGRHLASPQQWRETEEFFSKR
ncbi:MAG TPA: hypothetical protein EYH03_04765 [Chromatiales bacterium]|nr:hypothetical protein [Chromatiales bacterium]